MKILTVNYQKSFPYAPFLQEKIGFEISLDDGDDPMQKLSEAKKMAEDFFTTNNPHVGLVHTIEPIQEQQVQKPSKETAINSQIEAISGCSSLKSLEIFKKLVDRANDERLTAAYNNKLKTLQNV